MKGAPWYKPNPSGLSARLMLFVILLVLLVLGAVSTFLLQRQVAAVRELTNRKAEALRTELRHKGLALARSMALSCQRAVVTRDYLFLFEVVNSVVKHDEQIVYGIIMDKDGRAIVHSDPKKAYSVLNQPTDKRAAQIKQPTVQPVHCAQGKCLEAVAPIWLAEQRWGTFRLGLSTRKLDLALAEADAFIEQEVRRDVSVALTAVLIVLLLGSVLGTFAVRRLVLEPIAKLIRGVESIRAGELNTEIKLDASTELNRLATAFNGMSAAVAERNDQLSQLNQDLLGEVEQRRAAEGELQRAHDELEVRVQERTAQLSRTNTELAGEVQRRKEAEEELQIYTDQLQQSNRELQDFAYVASHDLQEPLRKVQAFGGRLQTRCADALDDTGRDYLGRMLNATERMRSLITELLSYSRVTTQAKPFARVALHRVATEVISDLEVAIEQKGAAVDLGPLPTVDADAFQMRQLLQNLIGNALKFQAPGRPPRVSISAEPVEPDDSGDPDADARPRHRIIVRDNGIGFAQKYADRVFGMFQRLHGRSAYEGTGMGLAICRKIVERHEGTIAATSAEGEGATFVITLPVSSSNEGRRARSRLRNGSGRYAPVLDKGADRPQQEVT